MKLLCKNSYYIIRSGRNNRHIKKKDIGEVRNIDIDRTGFYVFLTELGNKDRFVDQMIEEVKKNQSIYDNAIRCNAEIIDAEPGWNGKRKMALDDLIYE